MTLLACTPLYGTPEFNDIFALQIEWQGDLVISTISDSHD